MKEDSFAVKVCNSKCNHVGWVSHLHNMDLREIMEEGKSGSVSMSVHVAEHSFLKTNHAIINFFKITPKQCLRVKKYVNLF